MSKTYKSLYSRFLVLIKKLNQPPWIILMTCMLAYGIMIPWLGLYSDDWILLSRFQKMGSAGLTGYFSTNRPFWGLIWQVTLPLLGKTPWLWHLFGLFWHWTAAVSLWWLVRLIWPKQKRLALWAGLLFAVYPGFALQPISITVGHMFIVYTAFFLSGCFLIMAQQQPKRFWLFTMLAMFTSIINLFSMEYFLLMHLLQPVMLWFFFTQKGSNFRQRLILTIKAWWPYFFLFIGDLIWRTVFFKYQTNNYNYLFLDRLKLGTIPALVYLVKTMVRDWWNTTVIAWVNVFKYPFTLHVNKASMIFLGISIATAILLFLSIYWLSTRYKDDPKENQDTWQIMALGCLALVIAGGPFWLTEIQVGLTSFASRFTLPFIFGAILIFTSLVRTIRVPDWVKSGFLAIIIGFSIGFQFQTSNDFRREWIVQKNIFWQLAWRIPNLKSNTIIFMSEMPGTHHNSYMSMSAIFDWNFQPKPSPGMDYAVYYPADMARNGKLILLADRAIKVDHLGAKFNGNTSRNITIQFSKDNVLISSCAHVMSPLIDGDNPFLSIEEKTVTRYSNLDLISATNVMQTAQLIPEIFGKEPAPNRCYYFEKADLAYQLHDWQLAVDLYKQSFHSGGYHWQDTELIPFIGSFAHLEDWDQAYSLTRSMSEAAYYPLSSTICKLWNLIAEDTLDSPKKQQTLQTIYTEFKCQN